MAQRGSKSGGAPIICLVGFMGAGKTSVGKELARRLGWRFIDLDDAIEEFERASVAEIFSRTGQAAFRQSETEALHRVLETNRDRPLVLAIGGGAYVKTENREQLKQAQAQMVWLSADLDELWRRVSSQDRTVRPLLTDKHAFESLYANRLHQFDSLTYRVDTMNKSVERVASDVAEMLHLQSAEG